MRHLSVTRWIASYVLAALLLQVMAPLFAQSRVNGAQAWTEICTVAGTNWVEDSSTDSSLPVGSKHGAGEHCVFCLAGTPPDAQDPARHLWLPSSSYALPQEFDAVVISFSGHDIRSRAPPL